MKEERKQMKHKYHQIFIDQMRQMRQMRMNNPPPKRKTKAKVFE